MQNHYPGVQQSKEKSGCNLQRTIPDSNPNDHPHGHQNTQSACGKNTERRNPDSNQTPETAQDLKHSGQNPEAGLAESLKLEKHESRTQALNPIKNKPSTGK